MTAESFSTLYADATRTELEVEALALYKYGCSLEEIADIFNTGGAPSPAELRPKVWTSGQIVRCLRQS